MKKFAKNMKRAFTITELVIVIAVIAILAAVLIPTFSNVISSARESAAMQECRNALTDYSAKAEERGDDITGIVFVNNGYAYVYLNSNLHLLGKLDDLANINASGTAKGEAPSTGVEGFSSATTYTGGKVQITMTDDKGEEAKPVTLTLAKGDDHEDEVLYIYYVTVNDATSYVGYFTYEPTNAKHITDNATVYSRAFGFNVVSGSRKMALEVPKAE